MTFKSEIVFVRILFPFIIGIVFAYLFAGRNFILPVLISAILLLFVLIGINIFYKKIKAYNFKGVTGLIANIFYFTFGGLLCLLNNQSLKDDYFANKSYEYLKVCVNAEPQKPIIF